MLEERPNIRRRVGSARAGSARVGSARPAVGRVSSARPSSDTLRPKLHTGRPSSAPVPSRPSSAPVPGRNESYGTNKTPLAPAKFKAHDVSHLNLKIEGKSIRSVAYTPRRHQPVSRGSLRVISSHGYATPSRRKQFLSSYKSGCYEKQEVGSDSEGSSVIGFGSTYTLPLTVNHPIVYGTGLSFQQPYSLKSNTDFGLTFTKSDSDQSQEHDQFGDTYTLKSASDHPNVNELEFANKAFRCSPEGRDDRSEIDSYGNARGILRENTYNLRPHLVSTHSDLEIDNNSSYHTSHNGSNHFRRDFDTTSNDGSECTVMSLGRRIQLMASTEPKKQRESETKDESWDTEWKELLKQNHELLLKLSSRDEPPALENSGRCDHTKTVLVHHSGVQTQFQANSSGVSEALEIPLRNMSGEERFQDHEEKQHAEELEGDEDFDGQELVENCESPECVLEDIIEESSLSDKSTPRTIVDQTQDDIESSTIQTNMKMDSTSHGDASPESPKDCHSHNKTNQQEKEEDITQTVESGQGKGVTPLSNSYDFSCTTDLPTYRPGSAAAYIVRSRWTSEKRVKSQGSKDLLEALQMIEDEEKKTSESYEREQGKVESVAEVPVVYFQDAGVNTRQIYNAKSYEFQPTESIGSSPKRSITKESEIKPISTTPPIQECPATLPVLQVLVEKVFLFTQDLAERWQKGNTEACQEELLNQIVEAEKQLENICIQEKRKEDPKKSPELHAKCEEKLRNKQEEMEARIQKNLELIRKLLDDKKTLTEQCEKLVKEQRISEKKNADKIKLMEDRHMQEMKSLRERITTAEQEKREKWTQQKTKAIKETTYRGLETKMKDLTAKHRDEISELKAQHWEALREAEEKMITQLRSQEEELKKKYEQEKEEACKKEREREQQRLDLEIRQSEQLSLTRLETVRKQQERDIKSLIEEHHRTLERERSDREAALKEASKEKQRIIEENEEKIRNLNRRHEEELANLRQRDEKSRSEWREQFMKEQSEAKSQSDRELRERLKRQRDKEIERAIKEIQQETSSRENEEHRAYEAKMKNLRERYENELNELESSERAARTRYLEMKSVLAQKEEEIVYLRARLHTQDLELCELQHMFRPPDD